MKLDLYRIRAIPYEDEFPDVCPECGADLRAPEGVVIGELRDGSLTVTVHEGGPNYDVVDCAVGDGEGYNVGVRCSDCDHELVEPDVRESVDE